MGTGSEGFPAIGDYGFLSDCETAALVAPDGAIEWLCLPRFDAPSVCAALLDRDAGHWRLSPARERVPLARRYEPGTHVLETTWAADGGGWLVVRDALTVAEHGVAAHEHEPVADRTLVRAAECLGGEVEVELEFVLAPGYAERRAEWELRDERLAVAADGDLRFSFGSDLELEAGDGRLRGRRLLREGERCFCALAWHEGEAGAAAPNADEEAVPSSIAAALRRLEATREYWRHWLAGGKFPDHPWRIFLQRSALTLKGLMYAPTGAIVAAPTTSLPETPGGERNWDYRYTWIRDASFTLWGLHVLGLDDEADDFAQYLSGVCDRYGDQLQIMYGIGGERELTERTLDHLSGYGGARPVRIGNAAHTQRQNDLYGALLDSIYLHTKAHGTIPDHRRRFAEVAVAQVEAAATVWKLPDQGIWEARGEPKHYVSSKVLCWVALDRGARLARRFEREGLAERWSSIADEVRAEVLERGVSARGVFRQHYETDALDASTLLIPLVRFLPPDDERVRATVLAIADELTEDGLVLRYRVEETDDGLSGVEGTFTMCSFWLVAALSEIGERHRARTLCERLLRYAGPLGLYAEEIEPRSGAHLGNFPQAFTHLALINAVSHVIADERREPDGVLTSVFTEMRPGGSLRGGPEET